MIYGSPPQHRNVSSRRSQTRKPRPISTQSSIKGSSKETSLGTTSFHPPDYKIEDVHTNVTLGASYQQEAKQLANMNRIKDRLTGQYLRFDVPDSLDDTVSRFVMAVMMRYKFETPGESSVHGDFELSFSKREYHQKCLIYAEPLIQRL